MLIAPLVRHRGARERALDVTLHLGERIAGEHVAHRAAEQVVRRGADPLRERLVREADLELAVEVEDRRSDAVGDEPQPMLALSRLELEPLLVIDVRVRDEEAAHDALRRAVRVIVDADPDRRAAGDDQLPLVAGPLAVERRADVGLVELVDVAAGDLDLLAADDLVGALGGPVEERAVDEAVALLAIDVGERHAERVQLALRQCREIALERVPDRCLDGGEIDAGQRAGESHVDGVSAQPARQRCLGLEAFVVGRRGQTPAGCRRRAPHINRKP